MSNLTLLDDDNPHPYATGYPLTDRCACGRFKSDPLHVNPDEAAEQDARAFAAQSAQPRVERLNWIGMPSLEVDIDVIVWNGRALVTRDTLDKMAESIRTSEIASSEDDAAYADSILATEQRADGFYDVTDEPALDDQLLEYGIGRATAYEASL